ncbi:MULTISPECIES: SCO family protein [unclassified Rickettsia]|uniref:SCO family protein n=1 Tax=unclassified Rickettsia TaxID=114295 RepID=UPI0020A1128C|nr:SCO family protein [Rickettsia endosymbiont of Ceutorhynchus assimilis]
MKRLKHSTSIIKIFISIGIIAGIITSYLLYSATHRFKSNIIVKIDNNDINISRDFTLIDQNGKKFKSNYLNNHLSLIYFGVTYSLTDYNYMRQLSEIIKILQKEHIIVRLVFITLDPEHDNSEVLKKYLEKFNSDFIGLTGSVEDIQDVAHKFEVFYRQKQFDEENHSYRLEHSAFVYLINSTGKFLKYYCLGLPKD